MEVSRYRNSNGERSMHIVNVADEIIAIYENPIRIQVHRNHHYDPRWFKLAATIAEDFEFWWNNTDKKFLPFKDA